LNRDDENKKTIISSPNAINKEEVMDVLFDERLELEDSDPKRKNRLQIQTLDPSSPWDNDELLSPKSPNETIPTGQSEKGNSNKTLFTKFSYNKRILNQNEKTQKIIN
tara:strand:+ start:2122 stop:2445 length:324 start_codon:yes stop_codon:yes gene_type:complete